MSNAGQAALIVVGTVVGAYFGYPQLGFVLGSLAGSALFPTQLPAGPRITDGRTTTASLGGPVALVFGTADVAGTVMWLGPLVQSSKHTSAKGGPQQTTYQYNQSIAIGLCEGPIGTLMRVWENGAIVYDIRPQLPANTDLNQLAETDLEYANRLTVSGAYAETFVLYTGTETQLADPTIEAVEGYGNVPGWRGLCYIVFPNRLLQTSQAWRHPNFRFEVSATGTGDCVDASEYSNDILLDWAAIGSVDPRVELGVYQYTADGGHPTRATLGEALDDLGLTNSHCYGWNLNWDQPISPYESALFNPWDSTYNIQSSGEVKLYFNSVTPLGIDSTTIDTRITPFCDYILANSGKWLYGRIIDGTGHVSFTARGVYTAPFPTDTGTGNCAFEGGGTFAYRVNFDAGVLVNKGPSPPHDPCLGLPAAPIAGYCIDHDGSWIRGGVWTHVTGSFTALAKFTFTGYHIDSRPLNPVIPSSDARNTEAWWEAQYALAVAAGTVPSGWSYGIQYPAGQTYAYTIEMRRCAGDGGGVTIASIIDAVCARAGLTQIDTTDMATISVWGYSVSSIASASAILSPLRSVGFFDAVESQGAMKFAARGKAIVATLTADDLGAYEEAGASVPPPSVTVVRAQDEDLPRSIRFKYKAIARDYQDGEQDSPFRLATKAVNDVDIAVPLCLDDGFAAKCAEVLWADAWAARTTYSIAVDQSWLALDCGDCIAVPVDGVLQRLRIVSETTSSGVLRKLSCVKDDSGAYISHAVPSVPLALPQRLSFTGPSSYELLDLPALSDADNDPGFYVAAQRFGASGRWNGCLFYQSLDGGVTFAQQFAVTNEATMGTIAAPVPASAAYTWDTTTVITVNVSNASVSFESRTDDAVLAGANAAAMGADGRWEILQFGVATQVSPTQWDLSRLLRGRRGTEHVIGTSFAADKFIVVSTGDLVRMVLGLSQLGAPLKYKAVSIGLAYSTGIDATFTAHGEALVPFSPVSIAAVIVGGDIHLSWIRRGRLGRTLMSGTDIPLSEATEAYQVDILSGSSPETVKRTLAVTAQAAIYTAAQQLADFAAPVTVSLTVAVYQISAAVGRGTPAIATLALGGIYVPPAPSVATITFGGSFDATDNATILLTYLTHSGIASDYTWTLPGSGKAAIGDYATDLQAQAATSLGAKATVAVAGDVVTMTSTTGTFSGSVRLNNPVATVTPIRAAAPTNAGLASIWFVDLYDSFDALSPSTDSAYSHTGSATIRLLIGAYDPVEMTRISRLQQPPIPAGLEVGDTAASGYYVDVAYTVAAGVASYQAVYALAAAINSNSLLAPYLLGATAGQATGTPDGTMLRSAVHFSLKPGYYILNTDTPYGHPSGYDQRTRVLQNGHAIYGGSGATKLLSVAFDDAFDGGTGTYYSVLALGQVYRITLDGTSYTHVVDSTDMTDARTDLGVTAYYRDGLYTDLAAQIVATTDFNVQLAKFYRVPGGPDTWIYKLTIERVVGNTNFTCAADVDFSLTAAIVIT